MKLSPDDAAASSVPPGAGEGPAAPSFPGSPGRRRPEDSSMRQQTRAEHGAAPDETARLAGGPVVAPPPTGAASPAHGQSAAPGRPVRAQSTYADRPDDTRPVSREWRTDPPEADESSAPDRPAVDDVRADDLTPATDRTGTEEDWNTQELSGYDTAPPPDAAAPPGPATPEARAADDTTLLPADDGPGTPGEPPAGAGVEGGNAGGPRRPWWRRPAVLTPAAAAVLLAGGYGVDLLLSSGDIPRNTVVAGIPIGGMSPADAAKTLEKLAGQVSADHAVVAGDFSTTLSPATAGITLDVDATVDVADDQPLNPWTRLTSFFGDRDIQPVLATDAEKLDAQLDGIAGQVDQAPVEASVLIDGTTPQLVQPADGRRLDRDRSAEAIAGALAAGRAPGDPIELPVAVPTPHVDTAEAQRVLDETVTPALSAPVGLVSQDGATSVEIPVTAIAAALTFTPQDDGSLAVSLDPAKLSDELDEQLGEFGTPPTDADFAVNGDSISVVPSVDGTGVDPAAVAEQLLPVLSTPAPRTLIAQLGPVPASFTTEQAQALGITDKVSSFTTNFTSSASGTNIRVVAEEVDGALVRPGETFSLNTYTGPRGTAQGYVPAAVISGGELSQAVGGGISQFATTMFNAVFFAGLEDVHHKPHSFYISRYPAGREATVYEGLIDLVWKNDTDTGIYVQTEWVPGSITVTFWGTRHYEIESVSGERRNLTDPLVQDKVDDGNCTPQGGSQGFDITVTRVFKDPGSGAEIRRENFNTHYAAEAIIHCVPPAEQPAAPSPDVTTPAVDPAAGERRPAPGR